MKNKKPENVKSSYKIVGNKRLNSSRNGNPAYTVAFLTYNLNNDPFVVLFDTKTDSQVGYIVENFRDGTQVKVELEYTRGDWKIVNIERE